MLCNHGTLAIVLVIELDDKSHAKQNRRQRDAFVEAVLASAGIPLLRVKASSTYLKSELEPRIRDLMSS